MIAFLESLPIGDAVRVLLAPPAGSVSSRVLRKLTDDIASETDPAASVVYEGDGTFFIDIAALVNGTMYHYRAFHLVANAWVASPSLPATPLATAGLIGPDPLYLVQHRLAAALKVEVIGQRLTHETGRIPVLTAPPTFENTKWPIVTVHMRSDAPLHRALGEVIANDVFDEDDDSWRSSEGWLARVAIDIIGWSLNPDQRIVLRKAIKKAILGNLAVFDQAGMLQVEITQSDVEDMESYGAPVYQTVCSLTCVAPALVDSTDPAIDDVLVTALAA